MKMNLTAPLLCAALIIPGLAQAGIFSGKNDYDNCILRNLQSANTDLGIDAVKMACKQKNPKKFNFRAIAKKADVDMWKTVVQKEAFTNLKIRDKNQVKSQYFEQVIEPNVHPDYIEEARRQFDAYTDELLTRFLERQAKEKARQQAELKKQQEQEEKRRQREAEGGGFFSIFSGKGPSKSELPENVEETPPASETSK